MTKRDCLTFPQGFLWGTATSAHQVEGNNRNNDWWAFEQQPGAIWHGDRSGLACDWWRNAELDFDLMAEMGHNTHRLSVEWSRIEPEEGIFDPEAMARYRAMLSGLRARGIEPMVTLFHFSSPRWLAARGSWRNPGVVGLFRRFVRHTAEELGDLVRLWCTINEPNVYAALGYLLGEHPPGQRSLPAYFVALKHQLLAHGAAYRTIHALDGKAQVGLVKNIPIFEALNPGDAASAGIARLLDYAFNELTLQAVQDGRLHFPLKVIPTRHGSLVDSLDFVGVNYYTRERVSLGRQKAGRLSILGPTPGAEVSDYGRNGTYGEIYPAGMYQALKRLGRLGKPLYVTENGLPDDDDDQRPAFLLSHLAQVQRAIDDGVDVRGYYHWSFTDNFEWAEGWALRFGLVALAAHPAGAPTQCRKRIDPKTQVRQPRRSATLYEEIIRANGITRRMVETYAPGLLNEILGS
jgi:beta-glucosidase